MLNAFNQSADKNQATVDQHPDYIRYPSPLIRSV